MSFIGEIKRRKIFHVAAVYLVVAWLLIQVVATVESPLNLPDWADTLVILLLAIGFPITLVMTWGFNLTPEGLVKEGNGDAPAASQSRRLEYVLIGLVVVALGWLVYRVEFDLGDAVGVQRDGVLPNSIAVLPFDNLSLDPEDAFFAAGIHESTLNQLAKIRDLIVIARTSVMQYKDDPPPIHEIAKALNVESIMEGSVRYADGRVLISAQLIAGRTGGHLWSDEFNRELTDVFAVQVEVAQQIAMALQVQLLPDELARIENRPTESTEAYQHYLHALSMPPTVLYPEYVPAHIESLKRAIAADPDFAEAYSKLAFVYYSSSDRQLAADYAQKAIELDPTVGEAHFILGLSARYYYARQEEARMAFERAIDLGSSNPRVLVGSARQLAEQSGQYVDAIRIAERAVTIQPHESSHEQLGFIYLRAGDLAAAARHIRESIRLNPAAYDTYVYLAAVEYLNGNHSAAKENLHRASQNMPPSATFRADYILPYLYGLLGDTAHAERFLAEQKELFDDPGDDIPETLGWVALGIRDKELALRVWTNTVDGYLNDDRPVSLGRISRFRDNWLNDPILEEPEFLELRRRLGFEG